MHRAFKDSVYLMMKFWGGGKDIMRRTIHQWRDWRLEYIGEDRYELIRKDTLLVFQTIVARNAMDAENECQEIIKNSKEKSV